MRKSLVFFGTMMLVFVVSLGVSSVFTSCEGPMGPAGPVGADGLDGKDGVDVNETCKQCHNEQTAVYAKMVQHGNSKHQTGVTFERNGTSCAPCHTSEGFLEVVGTTNTTTAAAISDPSPISCRTCHKVHESYTTADFALRTTAGMKSQINNAVTFSIGVSNICANCHQSRPVSPMPVKGGANIDISNYRWGPHHGPQVNMMYGTDNYKIAGSVTYPVEGASKHYEAGCHGCHMAPAYGGQAGGHNFGVSYEYHGEVEFNVAGCNVCHTSQPFKTATVEAKINEVKAKFNSLHALLAAKGWIDADGYILGPDGKQAGSANKRNLTPDQAGVLLAYKTVQEDRSWGMHNPLFINALLDNAIEYMQTQ